jgi:hypothetical protein
VRSRATLRRARTPDRSRARSCPARRGRAGTGTSERRPGPGCPSGGPAARALAARRPRRRPRPPVPGQRGGHPGPSRRRTAPAESCRHRPARRGSGGGDVRDHRRRARAARRDRSAALVGARAPSTAAAPRRDRVWCTGPCRGPGGDGAAPGAGGRARCRAPGPTSDEPASTRRARPPGDRTRRTRSSTAPTRAPVWAHAPRAPPAPGSARELLRRRAGDR